MREEQFNEKMPAKTDEPILGVYHSRVTKECNRGRELLCELEKIADTLMPIPNEPCDESPKEKEPQGVVEHLIQQHEYNVSNNNKLEYLIKHLKKIIGT